jgi:Holliday junction resolvase
MGDNLTSNKKNGSSFERRFAQALAPTHWVHIIKDNQNGQPFDIIAVENDFAKAFDCKLCKGDIFRYSRIEVNQHLAFKRMRERGNSFCYLALCFASEPDRAYIVPYEVVHKLKRDIYYGEVKSLADYCIKLD